jgi:hypothetical protein
MRGGMSEHSISSECMALASILPLKVAHKQVTFSHQCVLALNKRIYKISIPRVGSLRRWCCYPI